VRVEAIVQVAVGVVEHERGLELQVSCPESTLATMLPVVIEIEAASVLKIELVSTRLAAAANELLKDLKNDDFSAKVETEFSESLRDLKIDLFSERVEANVREALGFCEYFQSGVEIDEAEETVVSVAVKELWPPWVVTISQYSTDMKWIPENGPTVPVV
jgi:hypothetical protein